MELRIRGCVIVSHRCSQPRRDPQTPHSSQPAGTAVPTLEMRSHHPFPLVNATSFGKDRLPEALVMKLSVGTAIARLLISKPL